MATPASTSLPTTTLIASFRNLPIPSCIFTPKELRDLHNLLVPKAAEAAQFQMDALSLQPGQTQNQLDALKKSVRDALSLLVRIETDSGQWINSTIIEPLTDEHFPYRVVRMEFTTLFIYQAQFHLFPNNHFTVVLDLGRPAVLDIGQIPEAKTSSASITGLNATWVNGLYNELAAFFQQHQTRRGWLHFSLTHTLLVFLVGFPLSLIVLAPLARLIHSRTPLPEALAVGVYVYTVLLVMFLFRIIFNYLRWVFPPTEIDAPHQHVAAAHKAVILTLWTMVVATLVKAALKFFLGIG